MSASVQQVRRGKVARRGYKMLGSIIRNYVYSEKNCAPYSTPELLACYAKLVGLRGRSKFRPSHQRQQHLSAFHFDLSFPDASRFEYLVNEIFIKQDYFFVSNKPDPLIIDCGSNIGMSIFYFKRKYPKARIVGFEPDPGIYEVLKNNVTANALSNVVVHNYALADTEGEMELFCDPDPEGSLRGSLRKERAPQNVVSKSVKTVLLSRYIDTEVDFLKVDVEGMEMAVMEDLAQERKLSLVREMAIEYHHHLSTGDDALSRMLTILENNGFGYQIGASMGWPTQDRRRMQDVLVRAYRK